MSRGSRALVLGLPKVMTAREVGELLLKMGRAHDAKAAYETAIRLDEGNADLWYNLAIVHIELQERSEALRHFDMALSINPTHRLVLFNSALLMHELGEAWRFPEARRRMLQYIELEPGDERGYFNLGMVAMDEGQTEESESWLRRAIKLRPDFRSALFNLALLLSQTGQELRALPVLDDLLLYHPYHTKALVLRGDILLNQLQDHEGARQAFYRVLELDPGNVQSSHNLCVVLYDEGQLVEAEQCLQRVQALAPSEAYVQRHLAIVQAKLAQQAQAEGVGSETETHKADRLPKTDEPLGGDGREAGKVARRVKRAAEHGGSGDGTSEAESASNFGDTQKGTELVDEVRKTNLEHGQNSGDSARYTNVERKRQEALRRLEEIEKILDGNL
uniref:protein O-mannosyl-transferase TMTC3-like n=1 Tax=Myxine glutinosa TaxID=7769 RepID=UPI00358F5A3E